MRTTALLAALGALAVAGKRLARRSVGFRPSLRERIVRLELDRADRRALREAGHYRPPVVLQRLSGRDGMGEPVVAQRPRSVRFAR